MTDDILDYTLESPGDEEDYVPPVGYHVSDDEDSVEDEEQQDEVEEEEDGNNDNENEEDEEIEDENQPRMDSMRSILERPSIMSIIQGQGNSVLRDVLTLLHSEVGNRREERTRVENEHGTASKSWWKKPHEKPQPRGVELLMSGEFGRVTKRLSGGQKNIGRLLTARKTGIRDFPRQDICDSLVPNSAGVVVASYPSSVYCGQFSADSSFYYVCRKDFNLHVYDMVSPRRNRGIGDIHFEMDSHHQTTMKVHKSIRGIESGWTITDSHLSPDNERLIYSAMNSTVYMVKTMDYDSVQIPINFSDGDPSRRRAHYGWDDDSYCIWSCRFSADGNEIIAGGREKIFVYDLLANRRTVKISAHDDDVNSCCWADSGSNVLISASDDTFIKVWDRRSLGSTVKPTGVFIGHTEGITNVSAKGDGRYIISNGKDQALRLWDLRKMASNMDYEAVKDTGYGLSNFDYRYPDTRKQKLSAHPKNCSIMTYRGHTVMRTLIRCHFSPAETTGSQYIYSGSTDGRIHIWSLDGRVVQVLDRSQTLPMSFSSSAMELPGPRKRGPGGVVRDVSWHSQEPVMLSAAWNRDGTSSVARHEWKGLSKQTKLEDWVETEEEEAREYRGTRRSRRLARLPPGAYFNSDSSYDEF